MSFGFGGKQLAPKTALRTARAAKAPAANTFDLHAMIQQEQSPGAYDFSAPSGTIFGQPAEDVFGGGIFGNTAGGGLFGSTTGGFEATSEPSPFGQPLHRGGGFGANDIFNPVSTVDDGSGGMGKRMVTVEVTGMQSATLHTGKVTIAKPQDLEAEGSAILEAYHERQAGTDNDGALMHTTVSGRLVDATNGTVVLEVYPILLRTCLEQDGSILDDWVTTVRDSLAAGVHPAPCALYARRVSKGVDTAVPLLSGADVLSAAKALLGDTSTATSTITTIALQWSLHIQATIVETVKIKKEVAATDNFEEQVEEAPTQIPETQPSQSIAEFFAQRGGFGGDGPVFQTSNTFGGLFGGANNNQGGFDYGTPTQSAAQGGFGFGGGGGGFAPRAFSAQQGGFNFGTPAQSAAQGGFGFGGGGGRFGGGGFGNANPPIPADNDLFDFGDHPYPVPDESESIGDFDPFGAATGEF